MKKMLSLNFFLDTGKYLVTVFNMDVLQQCKNYSSIEALLSEGGNCMLYFFIPLIKNLLSF